jgi:signal transduction histidine kinase/DNA-binding response OmpR family regulator
MPSGEIDSPAGPEADAAWDGKVNILIVDDQPESLLALEATLAVLGQNVVKAGSGRQALQLLLRQKFAVILLDVVMPEMDGFEVAELIRSREASRHVPIIFLTALSRGELPPSRAYSLGAVDYILKPIEPQVLRSKVAAFVELARKTEIVRAQEIRLRQIERQRLEQELAQAEQRLEAERAAAREAAMRRQIESISAQHRWLQAVFEAIPTPLVLLEAGPGNVVMANRAASLIGDGALLGRGPPGAEGSEALTDATGGSLEGEGSLLVRAARGETFDGTEIAWRRGLQSGVLMAYSEELPAVFGHDRTVLLVLQDVTRLKVTEAELRQAVQARDDFLSVASHELRTPLTSALLQIASARAASAPGDRVAARLGKAEVSLRRLAQQLEDLLDVSRLSAGKLPLSIARVDFANVVREVLARLDDDLATAGCRLGVDVASIDGAWDARRLEQIVTNLLTNAAKYGRGSPVEVSLSGDEWTATLQVRDHGVGIAPDERARIFERFERGGGARGRRAGFGLGLWIVKRIVSELGGRIDVQSAVGEGATFTLVLPRNLEALQAAASR